jgi:hypothetical protein
MPPLAVSTPHSLVTAPVDFAPRAVGIMDAASLVGVLPDAIDVTIESDEPDLRGFSGTYYYSFSVTFPWDPRIRSWAWTLDSTGPLDKWNSVWGAKWTRVEPIGTMSERQRRLAMPLIKVSARGTGVIAQWT